MNSSIMNQVFEFFCTFSVGGSEADMPKELASVDRG